MRYLASYVLLSLAGKENPTEKDLLAVLSNIGAEGKEEVAKQVVSQLSGKCITELCKEGQSKISSMTVSAAPAAQANAGAAKQETKKEEKPKTVEEEENVDIGDLFG